MIKSSDFGKLREKVVTGMLRVRRVVSTNVSKGHLGDKFWRFLEILGIFVPLVNYSDLKFLQKNSQKIKGSSEIWNAPRNSRKGPKSKV